MSKPWNTLAAAAAMGSQLAFSPMAAAEMGLVPVGPGGVYLSIFGGYVNHDGPKTAGHQPDGSSSPAFLLEVDDGGFVGGTLGFVLPRGFVPIPGASNVRIEASFSAIHFADETVATAGNNNSLRDLICCGGSSSRDNGFSRQERTVHDGALAMKGDWNIGHGASLTGGLELFIRKSEDKTLSHIFGGVGTERFRTADVDAWFYGVMVVLQPEVGLGGGLSFVGDFGAGIYGFGADADFTRTDVPSISDNKSNVGFRGRAVGGLKIAFTPNVAGTLFGGINYWSDVPFGRMPSNDTEPVGLTSHIQSKDLTELLAGARLTVSLGRLAN